MLVFIAVIIIVSSESGRCSGVLKVGSIIERHYLSAVIFHIGCNCARNTTINVCNLGITLNIRP